ncbi:MAG: LamG domain-containing protein, partial [Candidatus Gracilibacteria bacterium]|nr:LamG domain-containing protein [Candidatus Gracilibacteria bacterium]
ADIGSDYSKRYPSVQGDTLGILLASGTLQPIQESGTGVDVVNTTGSYVMQFDKDTKISGTGMVLKAGIAGGGLVGYWSFDEGTGNIAYDRSGNGNDGILTGSILPNWVNGKLTNGLSFSGNGNYVTPGKKLEMTGRFSLSMWVKPTALDITPTHAVGFLGNAEWGGLGGKGYHMGWYRTNSFNFLIEEKASATGIGIPPAQYFSGNTWVYVTGVFDGYNASIYINGARLGTQGGVKPASGASYNLQIGRDPQGGWTDPEFSGTLDEVRIYNRALSDSEVQALYNSAR